MLHELVGAKPHGRRHAKADMRLFASSAASHDAEQAGTGAMAPGVHWPPLAILLTWPP